MYFIALITQIDAKLDHHGARTSVKLRMEPTLDSISKSNQVRSKVTKEQLIELRHKYHILDTMRLGAPKKDDKPCNVKGDNVTVYLEVVYVKLRFPIQPFFCRVLCALGLAPAQLNLNAYRFLVPFYVLYKKLKLGEP